VLDAVFHATFVFVPLEDFSAVYDYDGLVCLLVYANC
jgi:hypothetical protein